MKRLMIVAVLGAVAALALAVPALADVEISDQAYVRHDGLTDITIQSCSSDFTDVTADATTLPIAPNDEGGGERQQNEPAAAVDPKAPAHMTAGANDYCTVSTTNDAWAGFYYSANGGDSWVNSLLPGYPTDTSAEGQASPLYRFTGAAGDPVQAWDLQGHLYYGGIAFNRAHPQSGSIWIARYNWQPFMTAPDYEFTEIVSRGTPGVSGIFEDKVALEVDKGAASPHQGNVYMCWARFTGAGTNKVEFARSTNGGRSWQVQKISESIHGNQWCDVAVSRTGTVFVAWRQYSWIPTRGQQQDNAVAWAKSVDGGRSFTKPAVAQNFIPWDPTDLFGSPEAAGQALYDSCLAADMTIGQCRLGPEPREAARSCGDGPLRCASGYVFFRANTQVRIAADPNAGEGDEAYIVYDASRAGSLTPTGTTYGTVGSGTGSQAQIHFIKTENGGASWSGPTLIDAEASGHQFFPDIDAESGALHVVWQDSRADCAAGPPGTAGDFRTVPIANRWVPQNPPGGVSCAGTAPVNPDGAGVQSFHATSAATTAQNAASWSSSLVSTAVTMPQHEQFGNRDTPFFGDYNYIDAVPGTVLMNWTDHREVMEGTDPRYDVPNVAPDDGTDGFDVLQCRLFVTATNTWSGDNCANAGGLDQSIFGVVID